MPVSTDLPSSGEATAAVLNIGTNALPLMLKWTAYEIPTWRKKVNRLLSRLPVRATRLFRDRSLIKADAARQGFKILGPMAAPAIPELIEIAGKPGAEWSGQRAVGALSDIGAESLRPILGAVAAPRTGNRHRFIHCISIMHESGIDTSEAVPVLSAVLADPSVQVRLEATNTLLAIAPEVLSNLRSATNN